MCVKSMAEISTEPDPESKIGGYRFEAETGFLIFGSGLESIFLTPPISAVRPLTVDLSLAVIFR